MKTYGTALGGPWGESHRYVCHHDYAFVLQVICIRSCTLEMLFI